MPIVNRVADLQPDIAAWRQDIHAHPELGYQEHRTAGFVAERLREFGCDEVVAGIGRTGVVGLIRGQRAGNGSGVRTIALRADMDALPLEEATDVPYRSTVPGKMHACGHDGHTAMLLGAARYLAETRNFAGNAVVIFQPAEENGAGAAAMLDDGLMERFAIDQVFGMHNSPTLPLGSFSIRPGPAMAAADRVDIEIEGVGCHAAYPHRGVDPLMAGVQLVNALQSIVTRNVDPLDAAVISICQFNAGQARNIIAQTASLHGTVRTLNGKVRDLIERRMHEVAAAVAQASGARITLTYSRFYPVLVNHLQESEDAARVAAEIVGRDNVSEAPPVMGAEDFAFMLEARPGAFISVGNGPSAGLHNPAYNFNDEAIVYGTSYWIRLVETKLAG
jgi:amidohydrolase